MTSFNKTSMKERQMEEESVPKQSPLCPYLNKMGPWIINVIQNIVFTKLNTIIYGPKHCQVLQEGRVNFSQNGDVVKIITDGKTLIHATFSSDAIACYKKRCEEEDTESQKDWEHSGIMLEEFKVVHVSVLEKEYGEFVLSVEKFVYFGEPVVKSEDYLELPFSFKWPDDYPDIKLKCQEIWELKLLSNNSIRDSMHLSESDSNVASPANANLGYVESLCREKTADQFLLIPASEREILDGLKDWKKCNGDTSCNAHPMENNHLSVNERSTKGNRNEPEMFSEASQKYSSLVEHCLTIQNRNCEIESNQMQDTTECVSTINEQKSSVDRAWLHLLTRNCKNRQRKLSEWRSVFKRSLKSFSRLKKLSTALAEDGSKLNMQVISESPEDSLITSSAPPDLSADYQDSLHLTKNREQNNESSLHNNLTEHQKCSLIDENYQIEEQRLIVLKDGSDISDQESEILQDQTSEILDERNANCMCGSAENVEKNKNSFDAPSSLTELDEHANHGSKLIVGASSSDDWSMQLSESLQVQCSDTYPECKDQSSDGNKLEKQNISDSNHGFSKNDLSGYSPELNSSSNCMERQVIRKESFLSHDSFSSAQLASARQKNSDLEADAYIPAEICLPRECPLSVENTCQKGHLDESRSLPEDKSAKEPNKASAICEANDLYNKTSTTHENRQCTHLLSSDKLSAKVQDPQVEWLEFRPIAQKRKRENEHLYQYQSKVPRTKHLLSEHKILKRCSLDKSSIDRNRRNKHVYRTNSPSFMSDYDSDDESASADEPSSFERQGQTLPNLYYSRRSVGDRTPKTSGKQNPIFKTRPKASCNTSISEDTPHINQQNSYLNYHSKQPSSMVNLKVDNSASSSKSKTCPPLQNSVSDPGLLGKDHKEKDRLDSSPTKSLKLSNKFPLIKLRPQNTASVIPKPTSSTDNISASLQDSSSSSVCSVNQVCSIGKGSFNMFRDARAINSEPYLNFQFTPRLIKKMWEKIVDLSQ